MHSTPVQRGHFLLESGLHANLWLELDEWFLNPAALDPQLDELAELLRPHDITAVCGPLVGGAFVARSIAARLGIRFYYTERVAGHPGAGQPDTGLFSARYQLPESLRQHARHETFAIVDDAISAGSSTRATLYELNLCGATVAVVGALLLLGERGERFFMERSMPVAAPVRETLSSWEPENCPLCQAGTPIIKR